jgi:hypothetical protein
MRRLLGFLILLIMPYSGLAQTSSLGGAEGPALSSQPAYPGPTTATTIDLNDYRSAAGGASIKWSYDGVAIPDADNQRQVTIVSPEVGKTATVKATLSYGGFTETFSKTFTPYYLDIILEPQTHVPTFYQGRSLPSVGSTIRAIALLNNGTPLGTDYVYTWRVNDKVIGSGPMRGAATINFTMPQGSSAVLSLQVSTPGGEILAKRTLSVPTVRPELYFYEINPLFGLLPKAIDRGFNLIGNGATLRAEPYHLDSAVFNNPSILNWKIDNDVAAGDNNPYEITLERTGYPGDADLEFEVRSTTQLLQGVRNSIKLNL